MPTIVHSNTMLATANSAIASPRERPPGCGPDAIARNPLILTHTRRWSLRHHRRDFADQRREKRAEPIHERKHHADTDGDHGARHDCLFGNYAPRITMPQCLA